MRVLHLIPFLWSGAGNVVSRLCLSQAERHHIGIVTSGESRGLKDWAVFRRRLKAGGVEHFRVDLFDRDPAVFWSSIDRLKALFREFRPQVVHCHAGVPACAAAIAGGTLSRPFHLVSQFHSWGVNRPEWMNRMDLWGFAQSDIVLCAARAYYRTLLKGGVRPEQIRYVPWGLPVDEIRRMAGKPQRHPDQFRAGFVGRIEPRKGQIELLRAFAAFHKRHTASRLDLVGPVADADYHRELSGQVRALQLDGVVTITGQVRNAYRHIRDWDVFVSMSSDEGQGIAILEAMTLGVPVIARAAAGVEDYVVDGQNALSVQSTAEATQALLWAARNRDRLGTIARNATEMIERKYSWSQTTEQMEEIYCPASSVPSSGPSFAEPSFVRRFA